MSHERLDRTPAVRPPQVAREPAASPVRVTPPAPATLRDLFDDLQEDDFPTAVPGFDLAAFARARAASVPNIDRHLAEDIGVGLSGPGRSEPVSGIRPSFPTLTSEVGALPNEPEDDAVFRCFGCSARVLAVCVPPAALSRVWLEPKHAYVLGLLDGATAICDVLDASALPRFETLCALEELVMLAVVA